MANNYGPVVSGVLDTTGRAWDLTIFQKGKAVLDKELNLGEDIAGAAERAGLRLGLPSGWLDDRALTTSVTSPFWTASAVANQIKIQAGLVAHVNGWLIPVSWTGSTDGSNLLALGAGPTGTAAKRTDFVFLEVWRQLVSPSPSATGKSPSGRIWWNGNVKVDSSQDLTLNFVDDILDGTLGVESTKRVQIQYRLRAVQGVDLATYPYGLDDSSVLARSVPPNAATPDGSTTAFAYTNQGSNGDSGLWRAGDGNPANALGTVDGYMYAIPLTGVIRRNTTAFDRNTNHHGGVASPGPSDRPDGLFNDIIARRDIVDARLSVRPGGWAMAELLAKNLGWLFDNLLEQELTLTPIGGGVVGATVLWADEIGISNANGGDGTVTGDTPGATFIGQFDAARRAFSDRVVLETIVVACAPPGGTWTVGDVVTIDPSALTIFPYSPFNWAAYNAAAVVWTDVVGVRWIGGAGKQTYDASASLTTITGLGAMPVTSINLTVGTVPAGLVDETLYVTLLVAYPPGQGLTKTPTADFGAGSFTVNNPGQLPASSPVNFSAFYGGNQINAPHREVLLQYLTTTQSITMRADSAGASGSFTLPERAQQIVSVTKNATPIVGGVTLSSSGRVGTFTNGADNTVPGDTLVVTYQAIRPLPQNGEQMTLYYEARAPQSAPGVLVGTSFTVTPRLVDQTIHALTAGPGSPDDAYPYAVASTQLGGIYPTSGGVFSGDHELRAGAGVAVTDFSATTGYMRLPAFIGYVPNPESVTFTRGNGDADIEGRTFFPTVPGGQYIPNAYAQQFSDPKRHRNALAFVAELPAASGLGKPGQLVLGVIIREALFDANNDVAFNPSAASNTTTAAFFRLKGNPIQKKA